MNKSHAMNNMGLVECVNPYIKKYRVRWNFSPYYSEGVQSGYTFMEEDVLHKPTIDEVREIVTHSINKEVEDSIISTFKWDDTQVWLSTENQLNYKTTYDLAVQSGGSILPVTFKFGAEYDPVYYTFNTMEELSKFYISMVTHINKCLQEGWKKKDSINWGEYEELLNKI